MFPCPCFILCLAACVFVIQKTVLQYSEHCYIIFCVYACIPVFTVCVCVIRPLLPVFSPALRGAVARGSWIPRDCSRPWHPFSNTHTHTHSSLHNCPLHVGVGVCVCALKVHSKCILQHVDGAEQSPICELLQIIVCIVRGCLTPRKTCTCDPAVKGR